MSDEKAVITVHPEGELASRSFQLEDAGGRSPRQEGRVRF
jgi:hypothetical protein